MANLLLANKLFVEKGNGMLTITERNMERFNELLAASANNMNEVKVFLYDHAINGIEFKETEKSEPNRNR
jgi:ribonuclease HIII